MIIKMVFYCLTISGAAFRDKLSAFLHELKYRPSQANTDVWLMPETKSNVFEYHGLVSCYINNVLVISESPSYKIQVLQKIFPLKVEN